MSNLTGGVSLQTDRSYRADAMSASVAAGNWRGEGVSLASHDKSLFASAAEEMSFLRSEKKSDDLSKRKIGERPLHKAQALERALAYVEKARELDKEKQLKPFLHQLLIQNDPAKAEIRQRAAQQFEDLSQQYLALVFVRDQLRGKRKAGDANVDALLASVEAALDDMLEEQGAAILAGVNVAEVATQFSDRQLGSVNGLRNLYRDAVLDYGSLTDTFRKILAQYGEERFSESVSYLISALGADLGSEGPSLPKERLRMIIEDLYALQALEGLDAECRDFLAQLERIYRSQAPLNKYALMEQLLALLEKKWIGVEQLGGVLKALHIPPAMTIYFWRGFKELMRAIPLKAYRDPFERDKLLTVIQERLDLSIEQEAEQP
ncbi:type II secretion target YopN-like protein [Hahella chejuensis KCTC 2396]|uniref:Type II secretion target YopN-like protein n=1 Tax=Hahella chejuensis (strain KCTC 2396) TaxID=349521 RepID=Q2SH40_HAHCH|nr:type III secretion system gatekeeper subunit SctW [Hahella chejuensis]ABC30034.1 type II secretion target YopN-like protein [Hahella chejuensis KCTC 2396]